MHELDSKVGHRALTVVEIEERRLAFHRIIELEKMAVTDLKQRSRIRWAVDGDENTRFFHGYVNNKQCKNRIHGLVIYGEWNTISEDIKKEAFRFYKDKFHEKWPTRPKLLNQKYKENHWRPRSHWMKLNMQYGRVDVIKHLGLTTSTSNGPQAKTVGDLINFVENWGNCQKRRMHLRSICYGTLWLIWKTSCDWVFKQIRISPTKIADNIKYIVFTWIKHRSDKSSLNWGQWCIDSFLCL
uniref:Reverse transcriptase zinc-binding domain-containing protein n=1 Tax=Lactuca sativa TaxID=4236 RepID=A0A9R1XMJ3_LACSA|nr:hypothetical protein LSAT_V11C300144270 [Lactuca sativa]